MPFGRMCAVHIAATHRGLHVTSTGWFIQEPVPDPKGQAQNRAIEEGYGDIARCTEEHVMCVAGYNEHSLHFFGMRL